MAFGWVQRFVTRLLGVRFSGWLLVAVPVVIGLCRSVLEAFVLGYRVHTLPVAFNYIVFYVALQHLFIAAVSLAAGRPWREMAGAVSVGLVLAWLPPIFDLAGLGQPGRGFLYFTDFRWHFTAPYQSLGESLTIWLSIAFGVGFVAYVTRSAWRSLAALATMWAAGQVTGFLVPLLSGFVLREPGIAGAGLSGINNLVFLLLALGTYAALRGRGLLPSLLRVNHCLPFGLCAAIGARMTGQMWGTAFLRAFVLVLAGLFVVIANDYFDREQDAREGGSARPVSQDDMIVATFYQAILVGWAGFHDQRSVVFLVLFFMLPFLYHHPAFRLKRLFCAAYLIEGSVAVACFLYGMGTARNATFVRATALLALGGFALGSMFKDYKDVEQDKAERMGTIYTRLMARGRSLRGIHVGVSVALTLGLLVPPVFLLGRGEPLVHALVLFGLAGAMLACLLIGKDRKKVVERSFWCLSLYLAAFLAVVPQLG